MKVIIIQSVYACGVAYSAGETVDVPDKDARFLIAVKKAVKAVDGAVPEIDKPGNMVKGRKPRKSRESREPREPDEGDDNDGEAD